MGMVSNKIEVMLLTQKGEKVYWELWLDNEISAELTEDKSLFSASSVEEFAESIGKGFKDEFPCDDDYEPDPNFIKQYCDDFCGINPYDDEEDDDDDYTQLKKLIKEKAKKAPCTEVFKKVVLVSNNHCEGHREYKYIVFNLKTQKWSVGCQKATFGNDYHYDPDDCVPKSKDFIETLL